MQRGGAVVCTVDSQLEGPAFKSHWGRTFLCREHVLPTLSGGTLVSAKHWLKTSMRNKVDSSVSAVQQKMRFGPQNGLNTECQFHYIVRYVIRQILAFFIQIPPLTAIRTLS